MCWLQHEIKYGFPQEICFFGCLFILEVISRFTISLISRQGPGPARTESAGFTFTKIYFETTNNFFLNIQKHYPKSIRKIQKKPRAGNASNKTPNYKFCGMSVSSKMQLASFFSGWQNVCQLKWTDFFIIWRKSESIKNILIWDENPGS